MKWQIEKTVNLLILISFTFLLRLILLSFKSVFYFLKDLNMPDVFELGCLEFKFPWIPSVLLFVASPHMGQAPVLAIVVGGMFCWTRQATCVILSLFFTTSISQMMKLRFRESNFTAMVKHLGRERTGIQTQVAPTPYYLICHLQKLNITVVITKYLLQEIFQIRTWILGVIFIVILCDSSTRL